MQKSKKVLSSFLCLAIFLILALGILIFSGKVETNIFSNKPVATSSYSYEDTATKVFASSATHPLSESIKDVDPHCTPAPAAKSETASKAVSTNNTPAPGNSNLSTSKSNTPSSTPKVPKKGIASCTYSASDLSKLTNLKVGWFYNWNSTFTANTSQKGNLEYVPMLWGKNSANDSAFNALKQGKQAGQYSNLLAFNEPDLGSQSNMTVQQVIDLWPKLMDTGLRLGSPAVATPYDGWLDNFMTQANAKGYRVDFIALHFYQDFTDPNSVNNLKSMLTDTYNKYKKPIWVTEIGTIDINSWGIKTQKTPTQQLADNYMSQVIPMLDSLSFVERYSWFTDNCYNDPNAKYTSLYDNNNALTSEGKIYQGFSSNIK